MTTTGSQTPNEGDVILHKDVTLDPGQDRVSEPLKLWTGDFVELDCTGPDRFYADLVTSDEYDVKTNGGTRAFPFPFGSDRSTKLQAYRISRSAYYRVVLRRSVYNRPGPIVVTVRRVRGPLHGRSEV
jgi:hypothetical protein